jgi:hypothetical protein
MPTAERAYAQWQSLRRRQLMLAWTGPLMGVLFFLGLIVFLHAAPAPSPMRSSQEIASMYNRDLTQIRVGIVLCSVAVALLVPWGVALAARTRRTEPEFPVFTMTQLGSLTVGTMAAVMTFVVWAVAAFRPDEISAETTRTLNDLVWFLFLFDVSPFIVWELGLGLAVLMNKSEFKLFPRWTGYLTLWCAFGSTPALMIIFFKHGPFAYNGLFGYWFPLMTFFVWLSVMTWYLIVDIRSDPPPAVDLSDPGLGEQGSAPASVHV